MALKPISGTELLEVQGVQANGQPSPTIFKTSTGLIANAPKPVVAGGAVSAITYLNAANVNTFSAASGTVFTLPAATGSGVSYEFIVATTVTSNAHKILPASVADFLQGNISTEDAGTMSGWNSDGTTNHSVAMNGGTTGGFVGDTITVTDIAAGKWQVNGITKSTGTAATPFSTSLT